MTITLNSAVLEAAITKIGDRLPEVQDKIVRKKAFDVVADIGVSLTTGAYGNPQRVDTGRLRASYNVAIGPMGLGSPGPTAEAKAGDGKSSVKTTGTMTVATVQSAVEYAQRVEDGTATMAPGRHVAIGLKRAGEDVDEMTAAIVALGEGL